MADVAVATALVVADVGVATDLVSDVGFAQASFHHSYDAVLAFAVASTVAVTRAAVDVVLAAARGGLPDVADVPTFRAAVVGVAACLFGDWRLADHSLDFVHAPVRAGVSAVGTSTARGGSPDHVWVPHGWYFPTKEEKESSHTGGV